MNLQPRRPEEPELNMTSLIDVVLLLVIFFMVSTTFVKEGRLRVQLPSTTAQSRAPEADPLVITITAEGAYRVGERALVNNARETLSAALAREAGARRDVPVAIRADARATHQAVVTAMDVVGKLGFAQVNIVTVDDDSAGDDGAR